MLKKNLLESIGFYLVMTTINPIDFNASLQSMTESEFTYNTVQAQRNQVEHCFRLPNIHNEKYTIVI